MGFLGLGGDEEPIFKVVKSVPLWFSEQEVKATPGVSAFEIAERFAKAKVLGLVTKDGKPKPAALPPGEMRVIPTPYGAR